MRDRSTWLAIVVLALAILNPACDLLKHEKYNVLLISVDTLRHDRLSYRGYERPTSPTIDALAGDGVVFTNAYSVSGWTLPSMATVMTGEYPRDHGATDFHWPMNESLPTLAWALRHSGYDTRGYISHVFLTPSYGIAEGFLYYDFSVLNEGPPHKMSTGAQLTERFLAEFDEVEPPFFIWMHYFDPHYDYLFHNPWADFGNTESDLYDQEIAFTDSQIARVFEKIREAGLWDKTIVVFMSDHGEEFGEHGSQYHYTLYDEVMRIPLVISGPGIKPGTNDSFVEQVDILPTVLALLGLEVEDMKGLPGRNVLANTGPGTPIFFERDRPPPYSQRGIFDGRYKLFVIEEADSLTIPVQSRRTTIEVTNVLPGIYMYDLQNDPEETHNIYTDDNPTAQELLLMLAKHQTGRAAPVREVEVDDVLREKLRSLGYIR